MSSSLAYDSNRNVFAISIFASYLSICIALLALILHDLFRKYIVLPSSHTRTRHLPLFIAFAAISVAVTWYYMISFFSLSYRVWADSARIKDHDGIQLGLWLRDTKLFRDAWEMVIEKPQRLFWSQPIFFICAAWSIFLGLEAQRHRIRYSWAYMLLGQLVAICFAQNLFYLAILLSPLPSSSNPLPGAAQQKEGKPQPDPTTRTPYRSFYGIPLFFNTLSVAILPYVTNTPLFLPVLCIPHVCLMVPPLFHNVLYQRWGKNHRTQQDASSYYRVIFRVIVVVAVILQVKTTIVALRDDSPFKHVHRHHPLNSWNYIPGPNREGPWSALWTSLGDHPAVTSVGWDTIICLCSLFAWTLTQKLDMGAFFGFGEKEQGLKSE